MNLEHSKTLQCLINAFTGESLARNRYIIFAKKAKKENLEIISQFFLETADNELEHAKLFYSYIPDGNYVPDEQYPFFNGNTICNLDISACAECDEYENIYKQSSIIAKEEGFQEISILFKNIAEIEKRHGHRFAILSEELKKNTLYKKEEITQWICSKCGHTQIGKEAPKVCPVCKHEQEYFKKFTESF